MAQHGGGPESGDTAGPAAPGPVRRTIEARPPRLLRERRPSPSDQGAPQLPTADELARRPPLPQAPVASAAELLGADLDDVSTHADPPTVDHDLDLGPDEMGPVTPAVPPSITTSTAGDDDSGLITGLSYRDRSERGRRIAVPELVVAVVVVAAIAGVVLMWPSGAAPTSPSGASPGDAGRGLTLGIVAALVAIVSVALGGVRALRTLVVVALGLVAIVGFALPAIRTDHAPVAVATVVAVLIGIAAVYAIGGPTRGSTVAALGTTVGVALVVGLGTLTTSMLDLTGSSDGLEVGALVVAGAVLAAVGFLVDVTVRQVRAERLSGSTGPALVRAALDRARDGGVVGGVGILLTLVLVFAGAALAGLVVASSRADGTTDLITGEAVAIELARVAACSVGVLLAAPVTAVLAAVLDRPDA